MPKDPGKEPHERWFTPGTGIGLLAGLVLGVLLGDPILGLMIGVIFGAGIGVMSGPREDRGQPTGPEDLGPDVPRRPRRGWRGSGRRRGHDEEAAIDRSVLWLLAGLGAAVLLALLAAPELVVGEPRLFGELLVVVLLAAVPGLAIVGVVAARRRRETDEEEA